MNFLLLSLSLKNCKPYELYEKYDEKQDNNRIASIVDSRNCFVDDWKQLRKTGVFEFINEGWKWKRIEHLFSLVHLN